MSGSEDGGFEDSHMDSEDIQNDNLSEQVKKYMHDQSDLSLWFPIPRLNQGLAIIVAQQNQKSKYHMLYWQWKNCKSCQNCGDLAGSVENQTSSSFTGYLVGNASIISILNDSKSWVRRKNNKLVKSIVFNIQTNQFWELMPLPSIESDCLWNLFTIYEWKRSECYDEFPMKNDNQLCLLSNNMAVRIETVHQIVDK